jgi:hypothetical protein
VRDVLAAAVHVVKLQRHTVPVGQGQKLDAGQFGAPHQMLAGLDEAQRAAAWAEITERLMAYDTPDGFIGPCELVIVAGSAPGGSP